MAEPERSQPRFNLLLSIWAGFLAFEAGALVVCIGLELDASRLITGWDGAMGWARFQHFILPICLVLTVPGALLRMMLGLKFQRPRRVALVTGAGIGLAGAIFLAGVERVEELHALVTCLLAGLAGGWVWWRVEKPWLARQRSAAEPSATPAP